MAAQLVGVMGAPRKLPAQVTESQDSHFTASHMTQEGAPSYNVPSPGRRVPVTLAGGGLAIRTRPKSSCRTDRPPSSTRFCLSAA